MSEPTDLEYARQFVTKMKSAGIPQSMIAGLLGLSIRPGDKAQEILTALAHRNAHREGNVIVTVNENYEP